MQNFAMFPGLFQITLSSGWTLSMGVAAYHQCEEYVMKGKDLQNPDYRTRTCEIACFKNGGQLVRLANDTVHGYVEPDTIMRILNLLADDKIEEVRKLLRD